MPENKSKLTMADVRTWRTTSGSHCTVSGPEIAALVEEHDQLVATVNAMQTALTYARDRRGCMFDFDTWDSLVDAAMQGRLPPNALENEQAAHATTMQAVAIGRKERQKLEGEIKRLRETANEPIPMQLPCPRCHTLHIDTELVTKEQAHTVHTCQRCGLNWKPALIPTIGVRFLPGTKSEPKNLGEGCGKKHEPDPNTAHCSFILFVDSIERGACAVLDKETGNLTIECWDAPDLMIAKSDLTEILDLVFPEIVRSGAVLAPEPSQFDFGSNEVHALTTALFNIRLGLYPGTLKAATQNLTPEQLATVASLIIALNKRSG